MKYLAILSVFIFLFSCTDSMQDSPPEVGDTNDNLVYAELDIEFQPMPAGAVRDLYSPKLSDTGRWVMNTFINLYNPVYAPINEIFVYSRPAEIAAYTGIQRYRAKTIEMFNSFHYLLDVKNRKYRILDNNTQTPYVSTRFWVDTTEYKTLHNRLPVGVLSR